MTIIVHCRRFLSFRALRPCVFAVSLSALASHAFATGVGPGGDTTITAPSTSDFARVLLGETPTKDHTLTKTGTVSTTYTAIVNPANTGLTVTADEAIASGSQSEIITFNLQNNANGSGSSGLKTFTVVVDNTATTSTGTNLGSADPNDSVSVTATVVANRDLTAGSINFGSVIIGTNTASVNTTVNGGSADDNNATRVNLNNGSASGGGVTVTRSGGTNLFDTASETAGVSAVGNFASSGTQSGSVNAASLLSNGESAITGSPTVDTTVNVGYTADVYYRSNGSFSGAANQDTLTISLGTFLVGSGLQTQAFNLHNLANPLGLTAGLDLLLANISGLGDTGALYTNVGAFSDLAAGGSSGYTATLDTSTTGSFSATYTFGIADNAAISGADTNQAAFGTAPLMLTLTGQVVPEPATTSLLACGGLLLLRRRRK